MIFKEYIHTTLQTEKPNLSYKTMRGNDVVLELNEKLCQVFVMK